jgi:hypothetical protein
MQRCDERQAGSLGPPFELDLVDDATAEKKLLS